MSALAARPTSRGLIVYRDEQGRPILVGVWTPKLGTIWRGCAERTEYEQLDALMREPSVVTHGRRHGCVWRAAGTTPVSRRTELVSPETVDRIALLSREDRDWSVERVSTGLPTGRPCARRSAFGLCVVRERIEEQLDGVSFDEARATLTPGRPSAERRRRREALAAAIGRLRPRPSVEALAAVLGCSRKTVWALRARSVT